MRAEEFVEIAGRLMRCPAAPGHEAIVQDEAEAICREHRLRPERDRFGNVLIRLGGSPSGRPLVLSAHLDHPGFEILASHVEHRLRGRFLGGVPRTFFRRGVALRLLPGMVPARLGRQLADEREFEIIPDGPYEAMPRFAVWDLPAFARRGSRIFGRACDDLIGVAAVLATLINLNRARLRRRVIGVLTRAEEVGFHGALALAGEGTLPKSALVISLETSREMAPAAMGKGVILRVGDRASVFDAAATRFLGETAAEVAALDDGFTFQRALMSGGTCEGTAYQESGYQTAAVCVALGNYHNCGPGNEVAAEYVHLGDALSMVRLLSESARRLPEMRLLTQRLPRRLAGLTRVARRQLSRTA